MESNFDGILIMLIPLAGKLVSVNELTCSYKLKLSEMIKGKY